MEITVVIKNSECIRFYMNGYPDKNKLYINKTDNKITFSTTGKDESFVPYNVIHDGDTAAVYSRVAAAVFNDFLCVVDEYDAEGYAELIIVFNKCDDDTWYIKLDEYEINE